MSVQSARRLAMALPDLARWVEPRAMLLSGAARLFGTLEEGGVVVIRDRAPLGAVVGQPALETMAAARRAMRPDVELIVVPEDVDGVRALLPGWREAHVRMHALPEGRPIGDERRAGDDVEIFTQVDEAVIEQFPAALREDVQYSTIIAARRVDGMFVAACHTDAITETLWDVGIDTLPDHWRRGYARDCYLALAAHLAGEGKRPVWGAVEDNTASLRMAASLGFVEVDRLVVFLPPRDGQGADDSATRHSRHER